jgi:hypothetical protein
MDGLREFGGEVRIQVAPQELNEVALLWSVAPIRARHNK